MAQIHETTADRLDTAVLADAAPPARRSSRRRAPAMG
jgi:hypothetical protein